MKKYKVATDAKKALFDLIRKGKKELIIGASNQAVLKNIADGNPPIQKLRKDSEL